MPKFEGMSRFWMENVLSSSYVMFEMGLLWLNVLYAEKKSVLRRRLGRWLADQTRVERRQSLQSDSTSTAERLSDPL